MARLRTSDETETLRNNHMSGWTNSRAFKKKREPFYETIATIHRTIRSVGIEPDPRLIALIFSYTLFEDPSTRAYIDKKNRRSEFLRAQSGWKTLTEAMAVWVVEKYFSEPREDEIGDLDFVADLDELRSRAAELLEIAANGAVAADEAVRDDPNYERYTPPADQIAGRLDELTNSIISTLSDELIVDDQNEHLDLSATERNREISKKALLKLRASKLREIAASKGLADTGSLEHVAARISSYFDNDRREIAELVLENMAEAPEAAFVTHLASLSAAPDLEKIASSVPRIENRYLRINPARWFAVVDSETGQETSRMSGELLYYSPRAMYEDGIYGFAAEPRKHQLKITLRKDSTWMDIESRSVGDVKFIAAALGKFAGIPTSEHLRYGIGVLQGDLGLLTPQTVVSLGLLQNDLNSTPFAVVGIDEVEFELGRGTDDPAETPRVHAVKLTGNHLLSSREACEHIVAGRSLVAFRAKVRYTINGEDSAIVPVKVEFSESHVSVYTGIGDAGAQVASSIHSSLLGSIRIAVRRATAPDGIDALVNRMRRRATGVDEERADILGPVQGG